MRTRAWLTELGRLPDENVQAIEEAGLFRMLMPVNRGGYGTDAATAATAMTHIASGCPSTAWVLQIYSGIGRMAESLPEQTLAEIYAERPNAKFAGTFGAAGAVCEAVDGGCRIRGRGRWPYNSGCHHAALGSAARLGRRARRNHLGRVLPDPAVGADDRR